MKRRLGEFFRRVKQWIREKFGSSRAETAADDPLSQVSQAQDDAARSSTTQHSSGSSVVGVFEVPAVVPTTQVPTLDHPWLVLAPPGHGKTLFLRSMCRELEKLGRSTDMTKGVVEWHGPESESLEGYLSADFDPVESLPPSTVEASNPIGFTLESDRFGTATFEFFDARDLGLRPTGRSDSLDLPRLQSFVLLLDPRRWIAEAEPDLGLAQLADRLCDLIHDWDSLRPTHIILALTHADELLDLPDEILSYLAHDPMSRYRGVDEDPSVGSLEINDLFHQDYLRRLRQNSRMLESWLRSRPGGETFLELSNEYGWEIHLCGVSSLGSSPDSQTQRLILEDSPKRVLDPLVWSLHLEPRGSWKRDPTVGPSNLGDDLSRPSTRDNLESESW